MSIKKPIKTILRKAISAMPAPVRRIALEQLGSEAESFDAISAIARNSRIVGLQVAGDFGVIQSSSRDNVVLREYALTGKWAPRTNDLLLSFFEKGGGSYIDVGANVGLTTIPVAKTGRVHCVALEPEPTNFANLKVNVANNCPVSSVDLRQVAVYSSFKTLDFEVAAGNLGDHRIRSASSSAGALDEMSRPSIKVEAVPLDSISISSDGPVAVKIDTQGAEPFVVAGGRNTLSRAELAILEYWPYGLARLGGSLAEMLEFLQATYPMMSIARQEHDPVTQKHPSAEVCAELSAMAVAHKDDPGFYCDVICRR